MPPRPLTKMSIEQLRSFALEVQSQANAILKIVNEAESDKIDSVQVGMYATGQDAIDAFTKFSGAIYQAIAKKKFEAALKGPTIVPSASVSVSQREALQRIEQLEQGSPDKANPKTRSKRQHPEQ